MHEPGSVRCHSDYDGFRFDSDINIVSSDVQEAPGEIRHLEETGTR